MLSGFRNHFQSEARPDTLPVGQNSPQRLSHDLFAEQLSGSAFTAPRAQNLKVWLYRLHPSVVQKTPAEPIRHERWTLELSSEGVAPNPYRWSAHPYSRQDIDWLDSITTYASHENASVLMYACDRSMENRFFLNADGELLIVPQEGSLEIHTELGVFSVAPTEVACIPRGMRFQVLLLSGKARGYVCENRGAPFQLPERGPIGANGLANSRDFETPTAVFHDEKGDFELLTKWNHAFFKTTLEHHPLDVVAWHGNYVPYRYDLKRFNTIGTVSFDHPDPSIFTVLTSPSERTGVANIDFVIFPPRWMVGEHTFRPPYYHRNLMSEFMGLIHGVYDAKAEGFVPGGASLHNAFVPHGPDVETFQKATQEELKPQKITDTLAFMFESNQIFKPSTFALTAAHLDRDYWRCWQE